MRFEVERDTLCGIELTANGQKLAWSIADYLKSLEQKVGVLLDAHSIPAASPKPNPEPAIAGDAPPMKTPVYAEAI